jgi:hypothetical protein
MPNSINTIKFINTNGTIVNDYAFNKINSLRKLDISHVISIGSNTFSTCNIQNELIFNSNLTKIGASAFANNVNLTTLNFSNVNVNNIKDNLGAGIFFNCSIEKFYCRAADVTI